MKPRENRREYWQEHLKKFYNSKLSQREYCRQANVGYWSFNQWKRRIENNKEKARITEIQCKPKIQEPVSDKNIIINLNNSIKISIPITTPPEIITAVITSLGE